MTSDSGVKRYPPTEWNYGVYIGDYLLEKPMRLSPRYWLRRWLVPELELSPRALAEREAYLEADKIDLEAFRAEISEALKPSRDRDGPSLSAGSSPARRRIARRLH